MYQLTADAARAIGGRDWTSSNGKIQRVYINDDVFAPLIDLQLSYYKTGNVSGATLGGRDISNAAGRYLRSSKVYVQDGILHAQSGDDRWLSNDELAQAILAAAAKLQNAEGVTA